MTSKSEIEKLSAEAWPMKLEVSKHGDATCITDGHTCLAHDLSPANAAYFVALWNGHRSSHLVPADGWRSDMENAPRDGRRLLMRRSSKTAQHPEPGYNVPPTAGNYGLFKWMADGWSTPGSGGWPDEWFDVWFDPQSLEATPDTRDDVGRLSFQEACDVSYLRSRVQVLEEALQNIAEPATFTHNLKDCCQGTLEDACELFSQIARAALESGHE